MVYGEGEEFDAATGMRQRYPTLQPQAGLGGFRSHCFICQPTVVFRRTMGVLLGPFDLRWRTAFDFDYWLRAFAAFPDRIGYIPTLQGLTRLHASTITSRQRAQVALEATALLARHFGSAPPTRLHAYALELQLGLAELPAGCSLAGHLAEVFAQAEPWISPADLCQLRRDWLLDQRTAIALQAAEQAAAEAGPLFASHGRLAADRSAPSAPPAPWASGRPPSPPSGGVCPRRIQLSPVAARGCPAALD